MNPHTYLAIGFVAGLSSTVPASFADANQGVLNRRIGRRYGCRLHTGTRRKGAAMAGVVAAADKESTGRDAIHLA